MKSLLFVLDSLHCGGAERSLVSLLNMIDNNEYSVDLLLFKRGGAFENEIPQHVNVISVDGYINDCSLAGIIKRRNIRDLWVRLKTSLALRTHKNSHPSEVLWKSINSLIPAVVKSYDVAIAYSQGLPTYFVSEKVKAKKKYAWINVDFDKAGYSSSFNSVFYNNYDNLVSVSDALTEMLLKKHEIFREKLVTIYDVLFPKKIYELSKECGFTDKYTGLRLLTVGRLVKQKGYDIAVEAAKILKAKGYSFRWYVVGDGSERDFIEQSISDNELKDHFILLGMRSNPYCYLKEADIYVQTSRFEGFGLTITEAKMFGRAIVSTNFPAIYNQIEDGINGLIADMEADSVAEKIISLIDDESLRARLMATTTSNIGERAESEYKKFQSLIDQQ